MKSEEIERQFKDRDRFDLIMLARLQGSDSAEDEGTDDFWNQDKDLFEDA